MSINNVNIKPNNSLDYISDFEEGIRLFQLKQFDQSIAIFDRLIKQDPINSELHHLRGILALYNNDLTFAIKAFSSAIEINSNNEFYFNNLGITLKKLGRLEEAMLNFDKALALKNSFYEAINNKANTLQSLGRTIEAIETYQEAIKFNVNFSDAYFNLGNAYKEFKDLKKALENYNIALKINSKHYEALSAKGNIECELENFSNSIFLHSKSININPTYAIAHNNLGITYLKIKNYQEALNCFDKALKLNPDFIEAYSNKGLTLLNSDNSTKAIECFEKALIIDPHHADALNNYGNALLRSKNYNKAIEYYDLAILSCPAHYANFNKAFTLLLLGKYHEGWKSYEFRLENKKKFPFMSLPANKLLRDIKNLNNKKILICHEQGLGDTIQFIRYTKLLKNLGAQIFVLLPKELIQLIYSIDCIDSVFCLDAELPDFDFYTPVASLPFLFDTNIFNIPMSEGYLFSNKQKNVFWSSRLGPKKKPRVGLTWSSVSKFSEDDNRSMRLASFIKYLDFDNYEFICLQKIIKEEDKNLFNKINKIKFYGSELFDFSDTAALANCLDLVITTCTSIPHLTGAMGIKTILITQYNADWRWLIDRTDSPWYKSVKIYRQSEYKNWDPVLKQVSNEIEKFIKL